MLIHSVGELMLGSAKKLAKIGADFLICPDNTFHQALPYIKARSGLSWLHIAEVVVAEARQARVPVPRPDRDAVVSGGERGLSGKAHGPRIGICATET
jgi:hypothetical protein